MGPNLVTIAYIFAGGLFILSLSGLSHPETARRGNLFGMIGMAIALLATAASEHFSGHALLIAAFIPAAVVGTIVATRVKMTDLPQLVAILHSFVGAAAVAVGFATLLGSSDHHGSAGIIHAGEIFVGVCVGAITFTGSIIAAAKLHGMISGKPLLLPARHLLNIAMLLATIALGILCTRAVGQTTPQLVWLILATLITAVLGAHLVAAIGGADMPVVVSMLNSYSGWAAAAAGFMLSNDLLIITGALVGSSGAILSYIMCRGMNRSFVSVILGGFGTEEGTIAQDAGGGTHTEIDVSGTVDLLSAAKRVVIVPGYGMAIARAQHSLAKVAKLLGDSGAEVSFAIHPVAGRLPGHMNVLLAEAGVPYDIVHEMEDVNGEFPRTDVVLVIGANDIVNPSAIEDPKSPIAGMPVLEVWKAHDVIVMKRSMASGYAGIANPLFYRANTRMLFGDAGKNVDAILAALSASRG